MKSFNVTNATELQNALKKAVGGDRILLAGGNYGDVKLSGLAFASKVTIVSKTPSAMAVFAKLDVQKCSNISFESINVAFKPNATTVAFESAVKITSSTSIGFVHNVVKGGLAVNGVSADTPAGGLDKTGNVLGYPAARGITVEKSSDINIGDNDISVFQRGIVLNAIDSVKVLNNVVHDLRMTPLAGTNLSNVLVDGNHFFNFEPWQFGGAGDHGDMVHFWTDPANQKSASNNIAITNNFFDQGTGQALLGIYLDDNGNNIGFTGVNISNNVIYNGNTQGVRLENVQGTVSHNTLIQSETGTYKNAPGILVTDKSNVTVSNNLTGSVSVVATAGARALQTNNVIVQRWDSSKPNYYTKVFVNGLASNPQLKDFAYRPNISSTYYSAGANLRSVAPSNGTSGANDSSVKTSFETFSISVLASQPYSGISQVNSVGLLSSAPTLGVATTPAPLFTPLSFVDNPKIVATTALASAEFSIPRFSALLIPLGSLASQSRKLALD